MNQKIALEKKDNDFSLIQEKYFQKNKKDILDPFTKPNISSNPKSVSLIIPASNVETSIIPCLLSIQKSSFNIKFPEKLQVIVVVDGSTDNTWEILNKIKFFMNIKIVRQKHFGQSQALNTGVSISTGEIIIFCDADMVLSQYAIEQFIAIHQELPNNVLVGFRSNVHPSDTRVDKNYIEKFGIHNYSEFFGDERISFSVPGWPSNMCAVSNNFKKLGMGKGILMRQEDPWLLCDLVFGALFSISRSLFYKTGGFDERFRGWGCSDGYLASKAISLGAFVLPIYSVSGLHISHPDRSKNKENEYKKNRALFKKLILKSDSNDFKNWLETASERIIEVNSYDFQKESNKSLKSKIEEPEFFKEDALIAVGKFEEALKYLSNKKNDNSFARSGKCLNELKKYKEAIKMFNSVKHTTFDSQVGLVLAYSGLGDFQKAHKIYTENKSNVVKSFFDTESKYINKGDFFLSENFIDEALKSYEIALISNPKSKLAHSRRTSILEMKISRLSKNLNKFNL